MQPNQTPVHPFTYFSNLCIVLQQKEMADCRGQSWCDLVFAKKISLDGMATSTPWFSIKRQSESWLKAMNPLSVIHPKWLL